MSINTQEMIEKLRKGERLPSTAQYCFAPESVTLRDTPKDGDKSIKVHLNLLPRGIVENTMLGKCVYDLSTCSMKGKIPLDDSHGLECGTALVSQTAYGLEADGTIFPSMGTSEMGGKRIAECLTNGIPQEASIDWRGPFDLGIIGEGETAQVNGLDIAGPCFVIQNWQLRAGAICKAGMYSDTLTQAQLNKAGEFAPLPGKISTIGAKKIVEQQAAAPAEIKPPVAVIPQTAAIGDAAKGEKATILQACIAAVEKVGCACKQYCIDACKTALGAIGQTNEIDELCEAGYSAKAVAMECADDDSAESIAAAHVCLKVCTLANDAYGWQVCSVKDGSVYIPKSKRNAGSQQAKLSDSEVADRETELAEKASKDGDHQKASVAHGEATTAHKTAAASSKVSGNTEKESYHAGMADKHSAKSDGHAAFAKADGVQTATISTAAKPATVQAITAAKVETAAPVVVPPVVEAPATVTQTAAALPASDQLAAAVQPLNAEIADLKARLAAAGNAGAAARPVPVGSGKHEAQLSSFDDALLKVKKDHPEWTDTQQYCHARSAFKTVFEAEQEKLVIRQNGRGFRYGQS